MNVNATMDISLNLIKRLVQVMSHIFPSFYSFTSLSETGYTVLLACRYELLSSFGSIRLHFRFCYGIFLLKDLDTLMIVKITFVIIGQMYLLYLDVNECEVNKGGCNQICLNKPGLYECKCLSGYIMGSDNKTCSGIILPFLVTFIRLMCKDICVRIEHLAKSSFSVIFRK